LNNPIYDLLDRGGKQWRPALGLIFAEIFGKDIEDFEASKDVYYACGLTEIVHNGSLICDDIEDSSLMRRGDSCIHHKFGIDYAINAGNFMYFCPLNKLDNYVESDADKLAIYKIYG
jgi:geranylgeranyl pyrophosphate synthase